MRISHIPEDAEPGLSLLVNLSEKQWVILISNLNKLPQCCKFDNFKEAIRSSFESSIQEVEKIKELIFSLYLYKNINYWSSEEIAEDITELLVESKDEDLKIDKEKSELFKANLNKLLSFDNSIGLSIKGTQLLSENQHIFERSRIITDIRPIFDSYRIDKIDASLVIHNLKISFISQETDSDIYFILDQNDLKDLKKQILRAEKKEQTIMKKFGKDLNIIKIE